MATNPSGLPPAKQPKPGQAAPMTAAPLETGLTLPSLVVPVGFGEVRVTVVPAAALELQGVMPATSVS